MPLEWRRGGNSGNKAVEASQVHGDPADVEPRVHGGSRGYEREAGRNMSKESFLDFTDLIGSTVNFLAEKYEKLIEIFTEE